MKKTLDLKALLAIKDALEHYYGFELGISDQKIIYGIWGEWISKEKFWKQLLEYPEFKNTKDPKNASATIQKLIDEKTKGVEAPKSPDQTLPQDRERNETLRKEREEKLKATQQSSKEAIAKMQARQKEIYEESEKLKRKIEDLKKDNSGEKLKGKVLYATISVNEVDKPVLDTKQEEAINAYRELSKEKPVTAVEQLQEVLVQNVSEQLKGQGLSESEIKQITRQTAVMTVESLNQSESKSYIPPTHQVSILAAASNNKSSIDGLGLDQKLTSSLHESINNTAVFRVFPIDAAKKTLEIAFGKEMSDFIFGTDPEKLNVTISNSIPTDKPSNDIKIIDLNTVYQSNIKILENQSAILDEIVGVGKEKARDYLFNNYFSRIISQKIESLPTQSTVKKLLTTPEMKIVMYRNFGIGTPTTWGTGEIIGNLALRINPQYAPILTSIAGGSYAAVAASTYAASYAAVQTTAGIFAAEAFAGGAGSAIATGAAAGSAIAPIIGTAIGAIVGYVGGEVVVKTVSRLKVWWTKNKEKVAPFLGIGVGLLLARFGFAPAILGGAGTFLLFGGTAAGLLFGPLRFFQILGRNIGIAIATPVIVTLLVLPPLVAFIMLVINNSAYVVPPGISSSSSGADNPYMLVTKTANPSKLDNSNSNQTVIYVVSIKALRGNLTNLKLVSTECNVIKKDKSNVECPTEFISDLDGASITPGNNGVFSFTGIYDAKYSDSLIYDTITISATNEAGEKITTSGSASVCIGDCPHGCFQISNDNEAWPQNYSSTLSTAVAELTTKFPQFVDKACVGRPSVKLCYTTKSPSPIGTGGLCNNAIYAITSELPDSNNGCVINFNQCGVRNSSKDAFFLLTHEISHHISWRDGGEMINKYLNKGAQYELPLCSYSGTQGDPYEGSAEANALYANGGTASFSTCSMNFQNQYPKNYSYAQEYMNNP